MSVRFAARSVEPSFVSKFLRFPLYRISKRRSKLLGAAAELRAAVSRAEFGRIRAFGYGAPTGVQSPTCAKGVFKLPR